MYGITAAFRAAITAGYRLATEVTIGSGGVVVATVPILGGTVTIDRTANTRRSCSLDVSVDGTPLIPSTTDTGALTPYGNEIVIKAGVTYPDGTQELVPLGVFPISLVTITDLGTDVQMNLQGMDRSWIISQRKLKAPWTVTAGTNVNAAITALLSSVYAGLVTNLAPTAATVPAAAFKEGDDPWAAALTLATAGGVELFFDGWGVLVGRPIPDPATQPVTWTYAEGPTSTVKEIVRELTRSGVYNDFIVSGTGTGVTPPVRGEAEDTDPTSPTYVSGLYGDVPLFTSSSLVTTAGSAATAAANLLAAQKGALSRMKLTVVPNPGHDCDDVITVKRARINVDGNYVVDQVRHTLGHGGATELTCRRVP